MDWLDLHQSRYPLCDQILAFPQNKKKEKNTFETHHHNIVVTVTYDSEYDRMLTTCSSRYLTIWYDSSKIHTVRQTKCKDERYKVEKRI